MAHRYALVLKFGYTLLVLFATFSFFGVPGITSILALAAVVAGFLYVIGDLWILPNFGREVATATNAILAGLIIWATELVLLGFDLPAVVILVSASLIGIGEHFFHLYLGKQVRAGYPNTGENE